MSLVIPNNDNDGAAGEALSPEKFANEPELSQTESDSYDSEDLGPSTSSSPNTNNKPQSRRDHDVDPIEIVYQDEPVTVEPVTGIAYPGGINSYKFIGCGVRTKHLVFHAYAVGVYLDVEPSVLCDIKTEEDFKKVLLDPEYPKMFRLVMNRNVSSSQYIGATMDALSPLMRGKDMDKLEEMKKQEMPKTLDNGTEIFLMVKGSTLRMQLGTDRAGKIESAVLTSALCENYLGDKPVSPATKKSVMKYMEDLLQRTNHQPTNELM